MWAGCSSGSCLSASLSLCSSLDNQLALFWGNQLLWIVFLALLFVFVPCVVIHVAAAKVAFVITAVNIAWSNQLLIAQPLKSRHGLLTAPVHVGGCQGQLGPGVRSIMHWRLHQEVVWGVRKQIQCGEYSPKWMHSPLLLKGLPWSASLA